MTDRTQLNDEQEYQFPYEEYMEDMHSTESEPEQEENPLEETPLVTEKREISAEKSKIGEIFAKNKRFIIIVGAVVVVASIFAFMRSQNKAPEAIPAPKQESVTVSAPVTPPPVDTRVIEQLVNLKQDAINSNGAISQLQRQVQQLDANLIQARAAQQQLNQSMMVLVSQVKQLTEEVKSQAIKHEEIKKPEHQVKEPAVTAPPLTFQIRAVVPGRAWIVASDGQSFSVAVGDHIPQYGAVQGINADDGVVATSSGKNIRFQ